MTCQNSTISDGPHHGRRCGRMGWKPLEIVAMVLGFVLFWPIGLAILAFKIWQRREGHSGDLVQFAQERMGPGLQAKWDNAVANAAPWRPFAETRATGNAAFDAWRKGELDRVEEERRKLADAERDFAEHLDRLRRARDREEFDRFMAERRAARGQEPTVAV